MWWIPLWWTFFDKSKKTRPGFDMYPEFWTHKKLNYGHMYASLNFVGGIHFVFSWILSLL